MAANRLNRLRNLLLPTAMSIMLCAVSVPLVLAADTNSSSNAAKSSANMNYPLTNPLAAKSIPEVIGNATQIFIGIAGSLALLAFVYGGLLMLTSGGADEKVKKGKEILVMATIGLVIIFGSYAFIKVFLSVFGLT